MSHPTIRRIGEQAARTALAAAWAQWSTLTTLAVPGGPRARSMVDPEALLLLSLSIRGRQPRLDDLLRGWARGASALLSVQRTMHLADSFPPHVRDGIGAFARAAADAGDRRWRAHAAQVDASAPARRVSAVAPRLAEGPALMLRLRAGFGVGARADVLAFLVALRGDEASVSAIAGAMGYSGSTVRTAAEEMVLAGFATRTGTGPAAYCVDHRAWAGVLHLRLTASPKGPDVPPWRSWAAVFALLADVAAWAAEAAGEQWSGTLASSRARDLVRDHAGALPAAGRLRLPDPGEPGGAAFLDDLERGMQHLHAWCLENL